MYGVIIKNNHDQIINAIVQAIRYCKDDFALEGVKNQLRYTLQLVEKVGKKRNHREAEKFAAEAKSNNSKWMDLLKDGLKIIETPTEESNE